MKVQLLSFSPTHSSRQVGRVVAGSLARALDASFGETSANLPAERATPLNISADTVLVCAYPVYGGRVPAPFAEYLTTLTGNKAKAIPIAVYGNRDIDDALLEASDILAAKGCEVVAAISAVAQHSFDSAIGAGRPNEQDIQTLEGFASKIADKLRKGDEGKPAIPGNAPYKQAGPGAPIMPLTSDACNFCGICAKLCPVAAIDENDEHIIDSTCILCAACIKYCPQKAKSLPEPFVQKVREMLGKLAATPREDQLFI